MGISLTTITGATVAGLSSPTYTVTVDQAPNAYSKQWAITALGGTQANVDVHGASNPFTITFGKPAAVRPAPIPNPTTGVMGNPPRNVYTALLRKGTRPGVNQNPVPMLFRTDFSVVAGADLQEPEDIRAAVSAYIGALNQQASNIADMLISNLL